MINNKVGGALCASRRLLCKKEWQDGGGGQDGPLEPLCWASTQIQSPAEFSPLPDQRVTEQMVKAWSTMASRSVTIHFPAITLLSRCKPHVDGIDAAAPAHDDHKEEGTFHQSLVRHVPHCPAYIEGPDPPLVNAVGSVPS